MAQRSQMNAKEKLGREIDLTNASKDELIEHLCKIIEYEVEKGEDADYDLVRECSDWLDELTEDEVTFTPEELERKLAQLKADSESKKPVKICKKAKLKTFVRVALIAAVIFTISLVSLSAVAMNKGYDSTFKYIVENVSRMLGMNDGELIQEEEITFIKNTETLHYSTVRELLNSENIGILYPDMLPNKVKITQVYQTVEDDGKYILSFVFTNSRYCFDVTNYYSIDFSLLDQSYVVRIDNYKCFITHKEESLFYALIQYNGFEYIIQCDNYEDLYFIIDNMKGIEG